MSSIIEQIFKTTASSPEKCCIIDHDREITYRDYVSEIRREAALFRSMNVKSGDYVILECMQRIEYTTALFALHLLGAVPVPLENKCGDEKISYIAEKTGAVMVIRANRTPLTYASLREKINQAEPLQEIRMPAEDALCEILFSTGTTGREKGALLTQANEVANAENVACGAEMEADNVEIIPSPINHSHGIRSFYANMLRGATVILMDHIFDLNRFFGYLDTKGANSIDLVPSALSVLLALSGDKLGEYRKQLRFMEFGSAPMRDQDREKLMSLLPGVPLYNFYGSTESGRTTVYNFNRRDAKERCIGRPTCNAHIVVVDENRNEIESDAEHTGLLAFDGGMNMIGYFKDPEETKQAMENGRVFSRDEAYFDEDGDIILLGRRDDIINIGGRKVSPEEIENAARKVTGVKDCVCIAVGDAINGSSAKLFIEMKNGAEFDARVVRESLSTSLEPFKIPKYIVQIDKIPRTFNGKILRKELK